MCLPRQCSLLLALVVNLGLTSWTLTFRGTAALWSLAFAFSIAMCVGLLTFPRAWMAAALLVTGGAKLLVAVAAAILAGTIAGPDAQGTLAALGVLVYGILAGLSGLAAAVDLWAGCRNLSVGSRPPTGAKRVGMNEI